MLGPAPRSVVIGARSLLGRGDDLRAAARRSRAESGSPEPKARAGASVGDATAVTGTMPSRLGFADDGKDRGETRRPRPRAAEAVRGPGRGRVQVRPGAGQGLLGV